MARIRITGGDGSDQLIELQVACVRIGRGRDNDIVLPGPEKGVSRAHAELRLENGHYVIVDLQSQNGTWVNGRRAERAEVPSGAEIAVGAYRLTLLDDRPAAPSVPPGPRIDPLDDMRATERHDRPLARPAPPARTPDPGASSGRGWVLAAAAFLILAGALAGVAWVSSSKPGPGAAGAASASGSVAAPDATAATSTASQVAPPAAPVAETTAALGAAPPRRGSGNGTAAAPPAGGPRITRRPGESSDAWRSREVALQTRYGYSRAALDRGDYAAAAGGFEAILLEEPGFLDAPRLLVEAQAGLRAGARRLMEAGSRLDQAGDWVGALQKYEQARQAHAALPGIGERIERATARLRAAGAAAFTQAKQYEAEGRPQDALNEYQKALQWLPAGDPVRQAAQVRIEHLKRND